MKSDEYDKNEGEGHEMGKFRGHAHEMVVEAKHNKGLRKSAHMHNERRENDGAHEDGENDQV